MKNENTIEAIINPSEIYYHCDSIIKEVEQSERKGITQIKSEFPDHEIVIYRSIDPINFRPVIGIMVDDVQLGKIYNMEVVQDLRDLKDESDDTLIAEIIQDIKNYLS